MNPFQIAWRSVIRKPVKSILLLLMVLAISTLLLSGMASKNASIDVQDKTRQAIGAGLLLEGNEENRSKRIDDLSKQIGEGTEGSLGGFHQEKIVVAGEESWMTWTDNSFDSLKVDDIEKIASVSGISGSNITTVPTPVNPVNFTRIEDEDVDQNSDILGVTLLGNLDMSMDTNVLSGNLSIKSGRMVQSNDSNVCVISEEMADKNNLKIEDILQFNDYHDRENAAVYEAKIIGIYQLQQKMLPFMSGDTYRSENIIFTDLRFPEKPQGSENDPLFKTAYFQVQNVDKYDAVKENVKKADIDWERYDLIDNNGNLETMSSNFNDLANVSQLMIVAVAGASLVILFLVFVFWLKNRVKEVAVFLSLGTPKLKILGQILLEAAMIAILAIFLSFVIAPSASKVTTNYLVEQQVQKADEQEILDSGKVASDYMKPEQEVTGANIVITPEMYLLDGLGVVLLITVSVLTAGTTILRKNPKDILSEMS